MMDFWDRKFAGQDYLYGTRPNDFLRGQGWRLGPGMSALAVADGEGRNGVWLAQQGLEVLSVDRSAVGLGKAQALARSRDVCLTTLQADLAEWGWRRAAFDVVVAIFAHFPPELRPRLHRDMAAALRPGGLILLEAFHKRQLGRPSGGPPSAELLYDLDCLRADFAGLDILESLEGRVLFEEGAGHRGEGEVVRLVARRST